MAGKELSQSTVIQALAALNLQLDGNKATHFKAQVDPSLLTKDISNEPKLKTIQGRGRGRLQQHVCANTSEIKQEFELSPVQDWQNLLIDPNKDTAHLSKSESNFMQSQGEMVTELKANKSALNGNNNSNESGSRGRGMGILKKLQNVKRPHIESDTTKFKKVRIKESSTGEGSEVSRTVVCNAVPFTSNYVFEYTVHFEPDTILEPSRIGFLNKHFFNLGKTFIYNKFSIFVPYQLEPEELDCTLSNRSTATLFTMTLKFKQMLNLGESPALLRVLFEQANAHDSLFITKAEIKCIPNYSVAIRDTKNGTIMCLDHEYYIIKLKNFAEVMSELEIRFLERFHEAVDVLLTKKPVFHTQDGKIYKMIRVEWAMGLLVLQRNGHTSFAKPENCNEAEIVSEISAYSSLYQTPKNFMSNLEKLFSSDLLKDRWNFRFNTFITAKARVLKPETIIFGDGVQCTPKNGNWEDKMKENEVLVPTELWCWMILYTPADEDRAKMLSHHIQKHGDDLGVSIGKPLFFKIETDSKNGYVDALTDIACKELQLVMVIIPESLNKPEALIKYICCIPKPMPVQIVHSSDVADPLKVYKITMQLNLTVGGTPWTVDLPYQNWMVCGIDLQCTFDGKIPPVSSFVTAMTNNATQWYSKAAFVQDSFIECFRVWLKDTLRKFKDINGTLPSQLLLYQNCIKETRAQFCKDYEEFNFEEFFPVKSVKVCVILVQMDTGLSFYKDLRSGVENVPPGTVVDNTVTSRNARDFFLTSHYVPDQAIARPTYYEVIKDTSGLTSEQLELITFKMCHLFYKQAKIAEAPAPCLYAAKLGALVCEDIRGIPSPDLDECLYYL